MNTPYNNKPLQVIQSENTAISIFSTAGENIDTEVVDAFGEEWLKFKDFSDEDIDTAAAEYFDILDESIINKNTYALDIGCGTGRWTRYLAERAGFIEVIDPGKAVFAAAHVLRNTENVRIAKASVETIPFDDETFDFAMSIGVLHHIPNTQKAMQDCVKKVKKGGYFYCYLYYNFDTKGVLFKMLFTMSNFLRLIISKMPALLKKIICDLLAVILYMPFVLSSRFFNFIGLKKISEKIPLHEYANKSFFIIRNDSLDRFGTKLEQRFSKLQVKELMENSGLENIIISPNSPFYHAVGRKK